MLLVFLRLTFNEADYSFTPFSIPCKWIGTEAVILCSAEERKSHGLSVKQQDLAHKSRNVEKENMVLVSLCCKFGSYAEGILSAHMDMSFDSNLCLYALSI